MYIIQDPPEQHPFHTAPQCLTPGACYDFANDNIHPLADYEDPHDSKSCAATHGPIGSCEDLIPITNNDLPDFAVAAAAALGLPTTRLLYADGMLRLLDCRSDEVIAAFPLEVERRRATHKVTE